MVARRLEFAVGTTVVVIGRWITAAASLDWGRCGGYRKDDNGEDWQVFGHGSLLLSLVIIERFEHLSSPNSTGIRAKGL